MIISRMMSGWVFLFALYLLIFWNFARLSLRNLNLLFFYFSYKRTYLVLTRNVILSICLKTTNRGRAAEASAILEGALADNFTPSIHDLVCRLFWAVT